MPYDRHVDPLEASLHRSADLIAAYRRDAAHDRVGATSSRAEVAASLDAALPDGPTPLARVVDELVASASPGLMTSAGPRYFGFVVGGSLDAALIADLLATGWDQNAFNGTLAPAALAFEDVAGAWLKELLHLPESASVGFVTGAQAANTVGLAAGRSHVLASRGWDVGSDGLFGAPPVRIVAGAERHATIDRALRLLGFGDGSIVEVPALANGEMDPGALAAALAQGPEAPTIVCAQAGNVNTGACDDVTAIAAIAREHAAWLHVDGAFGLWAAASPRTAPARRRRRARRLLGLRRTQVAERPLRRRLCVLRASADARGGDGVHRLLPLRPGGGASLRRRRLHTGVVPAGTGIRDLGGAAIARPLGRHRPR